MPRIRTIKPDFFMDEKLSEVSRDHRLLFAGIWQHCDVAGRASVTAKYLKATVFPYDEDLPIGVVATMLDTLEGKGFIVRYEIDGKAYLWVVNFRRHQRFSGSEATTPSQIPPCPAERRGSARETDAENRGQAAGIPETTEEAPAKHPGSTQEAPRNPGRERKGRERTPPTPAGGPWLYLPESFDTEGVRAAYGDFQAHRSQLGKGQYSEKGLENLCGSFRNADATPRQVEGFIRFCLGSGWIGLPVGALARYLAENPDRGPQPPATPDDIEAKEALASR